MRHAWLCGVLAAGCAQLGPPADAVETPAPRGDCAWRAAIEDGEDEDSRVLAREGRGGYLYTYRDDLGTEISPSGDFSMTRSGANGSQYSLRMMGKVADASDAYAGMGLSLRDPKAPYDASRYDGIAFFARRAPGSAANVRLKVPDASTDPDGGACTECFNDFGVDFQVAEEWTRYVVTFSDLKQQDGWGDPQPAAVDASALYGLQWQIVDRGAAFDLWIDDVTFVGCEQSP